MQNQRKINNILQLNMVLALIEGMLVLWSYMKEPSEPGSAVLFGFSYLRLTLILIVLFLLFIILVLFIGSFKSSWQTRARDFFTQLVNRKGIFWAAALWIAISYILVFLSDRQLGNLVSYRERLLPILLWLAALVIQFCFVLLYLRGINRRAWRDQRGVFMPALLILILFGLLLFLIRFTRIGLTPDSIYWQEPGVPLLLHQVFLAAFAGLSFYLLLEWATHEKHTRIDAFLFLGLWGLGCLLWLSQPARLTHFSLEPTPPNYQIYPFSDSLLYDNTAREYLIGKPIPSDFWAKPLYSFFLALLHAFVGGNYTLLLALQVVFLAVIPSVAYLLMARLGSRPAGVILALLLILRERNALALSNVIEVSHVKLLLSDVFAMGLMVLLLWLFFDWVELPGERRLTPLVLGGVFSLLVLTRGHPILLLPFIVGAVVLVPFPRLQLRWEAVALTLLGFVIPLVPWFWRNYQFTGQLAFQYPVSPYSAQMSKAYSFEPTVFDPENLPPRDPGESDLAYYDRLQSQATGFVLQHPGQVAKFISAHYFHNLIFSYIYLPYSFRIEDVREYVKTEPFWSNWQGNFSGEGQILLLMNLSLIALGFGTLWKKYKYLAFVPMLFGIGYNLSVSIGRLSGWRFILPADWITLIYYALGLMQVYHLLRSLTSDGRHLVNEQRTLDAVYPLKRSSLAGFIVLFLGISLALTQGHELFSQRYPPKSELQLTEDYSRTTEAMPLTLSSAQLHSFLEADSAVIAYGQALNPSFRAPDKEGLNVSWPVYYFWPSYKPRPFARVIFNLNGPESAGVILPMQTPPTAFPDGADVIVIGCRAETGEIYASAVLIQGPSPIHYMGAPMAACPFSGPP